MGWCRALNRAKAERSLGQRLRRRVSVIQIKSKNEPEVDFVKQLALQNNEGINRKARSGNPARRSEAAYSMGEAKLRMAGFCPWIWARRSKSAKGDSLPCRIIKGSEAERILKTALA
jgi:hypothetical protein